MQKEHSMKIKYFCSEEIHPLKFYPLYNYVQIGKQKDINIILFPSKGSH